MGGQIFSFKVSDADRYQLTLNGIPLAIGPGKVGSAEDEFFTAEQGTPSFVFTEGMDGSGSRSKTNSRWVKMSVAYIQGASLNAVLSAAITLDENQPNGAGVGTFSLADLSGTSAIFCPYAWLTQRPSMSIKRKPSERKWLIEAMWETFIVGGN